MQGVQPVAICLSKMLILAYKSTQFYNPEDYNLNFMLLYILSQRGQPRYGLDSPNETELIAMIWTKLLLSKDMSICGIFHK
jgi:hypothetical protein